MINCVIFISEASVTAGLAALAVMLIRLAMKKAPKRWAYALWAVVFFRCLCPFSAESALSLFNVIPERTPEETIEVMDSSGAVSEVNYYPSVILQVERNLKNYGYSTPPPAAAPAEPEKAVPAENPLFHVYYVIFAVWAVGAGAMVLYGVISYILLMRKLRTAVKTEDGVYESDLISTAFSAGFFPPKIYVPCGLFEEERKLIVAHERVHIKRLDYIVKPLAFLGLTVHWFNPLIWLSFALMTRDMELSCDEAVLKIFGAGEKKAYSEALLHVSMKRSGLIDNYKFMPLAFAETGIKGRVKNVLKYKKPTLIVTVLAAAVVIAACAALGTNAKSKAEDTDEIRYVILQNDINNILSDADGEQIFLFKDLDNSTEKGIVEGEASFDSVVFSFDKGIIGHFIMDADIAELKINSLDVYQEDGKNILKMLMAFKVDDGFVSHGQMVRVSGASSDNKLRYRMTEGGDGVYTVSAECELEEDGSNGYSFMLYGFDDIPVYVNADLVKPNEDVYVPLSEGDTGYTLDGGENVSIAYDPDREATVEGMQNIKFQTNLREGSKHRSVMIGMRAKNNELNRQCGADFTGEEITGLAIDDISVSQDKFTVKFKITYPEGGGGFFVDENEPNSPIRVVRSSNKNVSYLYLTADYYRGNVDEYAIDINGFDDIPVLINSRYKTTEEKAAEYTAVSDGSVHFTLETGETGYIAYDVNDIPVNADDWTFSTKGIEDSGVTIGCFKTTANGSRAVDFDSVLDFGGQTITAVTVENIYTEKSGSNVKLYTEIRVASTDGNGLMNNMTLNDGNCEIAVAKLINDEYLFTIVKDYDTKDVVIYDFDIVMSGLDDVPVYVNSALDPVQMPHITLANMGEDLTEEEKAIREAEMRRIFWETEEKRQKIEEQRRIAEEAAEQKKLADEEKQRRREEEEQKRLAEEAEGKYNVSVTASYTALQYPVDGVITSGYGDGRGHKGVDFYAEKGTEIYAAADGTVSETGSGWNGGYGNSITIDHGSGIETVYAHFSDITVKEGDEVAKGDLIGHAGSTGDTTQNGIHFEVKINGFWKDPADYFEKSESNIEKTVSSRYFGTDLITAITLYENGTFLAENYTSSYFPLERPEKSYKFENGILSLEYNNGSVQCFEAIGNDLVYRKDMSNYIYSIDVPQYSGNGTLELIEGTSLNGGRIEMETMELGGKAYFLVSNETQLRAIGGILYNLDFNYIQQCDIELSPDEWKAVGTRANPFTGSYNGNGFEIKGLTMTDPYAPLIGMFGYAENANIYNITLRDYDIEKAGSKAKTKSVAPIVAINVGSRVYDNFIYPKE